MRRGAPQGERHGLAGERHLSRGGRGVRGCRGVTRRRGVGRCRCRRLAGERGPDGDGVGVGRRRRRVQGERGREVAGGDEWRGPEGGPGRRGRGRVGRGRRGGCCTARGLGVRHRGAGVLTDGRRRRPRRATTGARVATARAGAGASARAGTATATATALRGTGAGATCCGDVVRRRCRGGRLRRGRECGHGARTRGVTGAAGTLGDGECREADEPEEGDREGEARAPHDRRTLAVHDSPSSVCVRPSRGPRPEDE